jgi:hypothetical protein
MLTKKNHWTLTYSLRVMTVDWIIKIQPRVDR